MIFTKGDLPERQNPTDAGADLRVPEDVTIPPRGMQKVTLNLKTALNIGTFGLVVARSSAPLKHGVGLANSVGIIDADYRGNYALVLENKTDVSVTIAAGTRIAQLVILPCLLEQFIDPGDSIWEVLDGTGRGGGGFGSTGQN